MSGSTDDIKDIIAKAREAEPEETEEDTPKIDPYLDEDVNMCVRSKRYQRDWWIAEAKNEGLSLRDVVIELLTEYLGDPPPPTSKSKKLKRLSRKKRKKSS